MAALDARVGAGVGIAACYGYMLVEVEEVAAEERLGCTGVKAAVEEGAVAVKVAEGEKSMDNAYCREGVLRK